LSEHQKVRVAVLPTIAENPAGGVTATPTDPLDGVRSATGIPDLAENFDDYRFGRRQP